MIKRRPTKDKTESRPASSKKIQKKSKLTEEIKKTKRLTKRLQFELNKKKNVNELVKTFRYERNLLRTLIDNL